MKIPHAKIVFEDVFGKIGRCVLQVSGKTFCFLGAVGCMTHLTASSFYYCTIGPLRGESKLRKQLFPLMTSIGVRSAPIVCLVAVLTGAILVLQTGQIVEQYGQTKEMPGLVALSMTRSLGPLMTAIVIISRVGASYTAVLGSMNINEEITALRTMSIHPVGYLVAPRMLSMLVMAPCLVVFAYLLGMIGGAAVSWGVYQIGPELYFKQTTLYLTLPDLFSGILKAVVFGPLISAISCHYGLTATGGPTGLGRNIMVSVVTCLVAIVFADALLTAFLVNYVL